MFSNDYYEIMRKPQTLCLSHIRECISKFLINGNVNLDYLGEVGSTRFLHCKLTIFPFSNSIRNESVNSATLKGRRMNFY